MFLIIKTKDWAGLVPRMTELSCLFVRYYRKGLSWTKSMSLHIKIGSELRLTRSNV